jgi:methionyl aminopeptidase
MIPIKTARDIEKMRLACQAASSVLEKVSAYIRPGLTTFEVDRYAAMLIAEAGCRSAFLNYRGFPGNICISVNEEVVHGIGGSRRIQYGDIVKLDIGVIKNGWVGDTAATVPVGLIDPVTAKLLQVTEEALHTAIPHVRDGRRLGEVCAMIEETVIRNGFTVVREFVGHGVGRKLHEEPQVPNYGKRTDGPKLKAGMTLAIEPMVNIGGSAVKVLNDNWTVITADGKPSAHFEHTVLVTKGEPEILTWREKVLSRQE